MLNNEERRLVAGRSNYLCCACQMGIDPTAFAVDRIDQTGEWVTSNLGAFCRNCYSYGAKAKKLPLKSASGRLIVITGPMYSEKSTTTKSLLNKFILTHKKYLWVKPTTDDRAAGYSVTHNKEKIEAYTLSQDRPDLKLRELSEYSLIAFDEVQFFSDRILFVIEELLRDKSRIVIVNGLKLTASRSLFGVLHYLMSFADDIICLQAVCSVCGRIDTATRTKSYRPLKAISTGATESYYAVCPECDGSPNEDKFLETALSPGGGI